MTGTSSVLRRLGCWAAVLLLAAAAPALAQPAPAPAPPAAAAPDPLSAQEAKDEAVVDAALQAFGPDGFQALAQREAELRAVLDRAPASYPMLEFRGDDALVRTTDLAIFSTYRERAKTTAEKAGRKLSKVYMVPNTYVVVSLLLGSLANERGRSDEAVALLDRGRALQPNHPLIAIERGSALMRLGRPAESVAGYDAVLGSGEPGVVPYRARLMGNRGAALIELGRLDEAEATLKQALDIDPGNRLATNELEYIKGLRAGKPATAIELKTPGQQEGRDH